MKEGLRYMIVTSEWMIQAAQSRIGEPIISSAEIPQVSEIELLSNGGYRVTLAQPPTPRQEE